MTPEERAAKLARAICACTCHAPSAAPADNRGPLKDGSHYANCPAEDEAGAALDIAAAIREAVKAEREACAKIADDDASLIAPMLAGASRRYAVREALHDLGYQGDPDAEIISLEAAKGMAEGLAAAIRARTP